MNESADGLRCPCCGFGNEWDDFEQVAGGRDATTFDCPECGKRFTYVL